MALQEKWKIVKGLFESFVLNITILEVFEAFQISLEISSRNNLDFNHKRCSRSLKILLKKYPLDQKAKITFKEVLRNLKMPALN